MADLLSDSARNELIAVLSTYPKGWGWTDEEKKAITLAEEILLEAKEPLEFRKQLLEDLLIFERWSSALEAQGDY